MFEWTWPWAFILLPLPLVIWYFVPKQSQRLKTALTIPFYHDLAEVAMVQYQGASFFRQVFIPLLVWCLLILALAGPRYVGQPIPAQQEGYNIMMILDLSSSMETPDMLWHGRTVSRLTVVKHAAEAFVKERRLDHIGLILFGERAYLMTPLTYDKKNVLERISDATAGLAGRMTAMGDALGLAVKNLEHTPKQGRIAILLTDGVNNAGVMSPIQAARLAKMEDIKLYTIGLGAESAPSPFGGMMIQSATADLDEKSLTKMANMTGGRYFRATDAASLEQIYQEINQLEAVKQKQSTIRPQKAYFVWPLAMAVLLWLLLMASHGLWPWWQGVRQNREGMI